MIHSRTRLWLFATLALGLGVTGCAPSRSPSPQAAAPAIAPTSAVLPANAVPVASPAPVATAEPRAIPTGAGVTTGTAAATLGRASVAFTFPQPEAKVASPVEVCLEATGIAIEPAGEARVGAGYFVLVVDPMAQEMSRLAVAGAPAVPEIDRYVHWKDGASCGKVALGSGPHVLLAVVVDGTAHPVNPPAMARVRIQVGGPPTE